VQRAAALTGVPAALIDAVITVESGYQVRVVSSSKAVGLMQLMPSTAAMLGGDPWDGEQNILMGSRYLAQLARQFNGNLQLTLAAYNAGPAAVTRSGFRIPAFTETRSYVPKVLSLYAALQQ
jgi:soluble lytic murein transglycosylase-like protein